MEIVCILGTGKGQKTLLYFFLFFFFKHCDFGMREITLQPLFASTFTAANYLSEHATRLFLGMIKNVFICWDV